MPNSCWPKRIAIHISISCYSSSILDDSLLFIRFIGFMVSIQRNSNHFKLILTSLSKNFFLSGQCGTWITNIGAKNFISHNEDTNTSTTWEPQINIAVLIQTITNLQKAFIQLFLNFRAIDNPLINFSLIKSILNWTFYFLSQNVFHIFWH